MQVQKSKLCFFMSAKASAILLSEAMNSETDSIESLNRRDTNEGTRGIVRSIEDVLLSGRQLVISLQQLHQANGALHIYRKYLEA